MQIIKRRAYARAGLVGNPSDGYNGKTISLVIRNYHADAVLYEWEDVELIPSQDDHSRFRSIHELARDVRLHGYYGGLRLVKATIKTFADFCRTWKHDLHDRNFSIRYETNIPRGVGLAGSSAIIVATLRALMDFYDVAIPLRVQPSLARAVETEELGISAGLQDRVIQVFEGLVYMDFAKDKMETISGYECGVYEPLDPSLLPHLYVAFSRSDVEQADEAVEASTIFHDDIKSRFRRGEPKVVAAMATFANLAAEARTALLAKDGSRLSELMDQNFDTRASIYEHMLPGQKRMVHVARDVGASAKFAGSGGAIVGVYQDEAMFAALRRELDAIGCVTFKPRVMG